MKNLILAIIILIAGVSAGEVQAKPKNNNKAKIEQTTDSLKTKTKTKKAKAKKAKAKAEEVKENAEKTQCTATTAKGKQCKRMTSSPSGKCWQHEKETQKQDTK